MKFNLTAIAVGAALTVSAGCAFAATPVKAKPQPVQKITTAKQLQLKKIRQKLRLLNKEVKKIQSNLVQNSEHLGRINNFYANGRMHGDEKGFYLDKLPAVTNELALLQNEKKFNPRGLTIGGYFEQDTQYWNGDKISTTTGTYQRGTGTYLTVFNIDFLAKLNSWTSVMFKPEIKNIGTSSESFGVDTAFFTIGNLKKSPFYLAMGQDYLPWGVFTGNGAWDVALTRSAFRSDPMNQIIMGYYHSGLNTSFSVFNSENSRQNITNFTYNVAYAKMIGSLRVHAGFGYLNDIRGTQSTIGKAFAPGSVYAIAGNRRDAAYDFNGSLGYGIFNLSGEYIFTQRNVKLASTGVNQGKPRAWDVAVTATPTVRGKNLIMGLSYSHTSSLAGLPMGLGGAANPGAISSTGFSSQWIGTITRPITKAYYLGLEGVDDNLYNGQHTYEFTIDNSIYF